MYIFDQNVDLALTLAMWERQRESLCENDNAMSSFNQKNIVSSKILIFRWKNVGLEPKRASCITF